MNEAKPVILIIKPEAVSQLNNTLVQIRYILLLLAIILHGPTVLTIFQ